MQRILIVALLFAVLIPGIRAQSTILQEGIRGGTVARTLATTITPGGANGLTSEGPSLFLGDSRSLIAFPFMVGSSPHQVPCGADVSLAELEVYVLDVPGSAASRILRVSPVIDRALAGPWHEPDAPGANQTGAGVSWRHRDGRPGRVVPWTSPGADSYRRSPFSHETSVARGQGFWITLDVTDIVRAQVHGLGNQGFLLEVDQGGLDMELASDDHANLGLHPRLTVNWTGVSAPYNHIVEIRDREITTTEGRSVLISFPLRDQDGDLLTYVVRDQPTSGTLNGSGWFSYTPQPGFSGIDEFRFFAKDAIGTTPLIRVQIDVQANSGMRSTTITGPGEVLGASVQVSTDPSFQRVIESNELRVEGDSWASFLDAPNLIGSSGVPQGATIYSAELSLTMVGGSGSDIRLQLTPLRDPGGFGPWSHPTTTGVQHDAGVSWLYRDARATSRIPWLVAGGEEDSAIATSGTTPAIIAGQSVRFDLTAAVQALALGATSSGFRIENLGRANLRFASERHATASWRPSISISWTDASSGANDPPPVAVAGPDRLVRAGDRVILGGAASYQPRRPAPGIQWFQIAGPAVTLQESNRASANFIAPVVSHDTFLRFTLTASDGPRSSFDDLEVLVRPSGALSNRPPVAIAGDDIHVREGQFVGLDATASSDPDGQPLTFQWRTVGSSPVRITPILNGERAFFQSPAVGAQAETHFLRLTVSDGVHESQDWVSVTVHPSSNQPPVAAAVPQLATRAGAWIGLDARHSRDPDPLSHLQFQWTQIGGPTVLLHRGETALPYFQAPSVAASATLTFEVRVSDGLDSSTAQAQVTVEPIASAFQGTAQSLAPYRDSLTRAEAQHLMRRAGYSASPQEIAQIMSQGLGTTLDQLMAPQREPTVDIAAWSGLPQPEGQDLYPRADGEELSRWFLIYKLESSMRNQLREKTAYFWHDLFAASRRNAYGREGHWGIEYLDLLRSDPFPNYRSFLIAITRNSLMLNWLDGHSNRSGEPNENYSRELWELFTLGETNPFTGQPNYGEPDVQEAARAFTGWERYDPSHIGGSSYYTRFQPSRHDPGVKSVFGFSGPWDDVDLIDITLAQPQAAEHICHSLFRFFVHDAPDYATIQVLATSLRNGNWEIAPIVRQLLASEAMFSNRARYANVKTPTELVVGFSRATGMRLAPEDVAERLIELNHEMGNPPTVKGWEEGVYLLSSASASYRAQAVNDLVYSTYLAGPSPLARFLPPSGERTSASVVQLVHDVLGVTPLADDQVHHLIEYMDRVGIDTQSSRRRWFNGEDPAHVDTKVRGLLYLVAVANAEYQLN